MCDLPSKTFVHFVFSIFYAIKESISRLTAKTWKIDRVSVVFREARIAEHNRPLPSDTHDISYTLSVVYLRINKELEYSMIRCCYRLFHLKIEITACNRTHRFSSAASDRRGNSWYPLIINVRAMMLQKG